MAGSGVVIAGTGVAWTAPATAATSLATGAIVVAATGDSSPADRSDSESRRPLRPGVGGTAPAVAGDSSICGGPAAPPCPGPLRPSALAGAHIGPAAAAAHCFMGPLLPARPPLEATRSDSSTGPSSALAQPVAQPAVPARPARPWLGVAVVDAGPPWGMLEVPGCAGAVRATCQASTAYYIAGFFSLQESPRVTGMLGRHISAALQSSHRAARNRRSTARLRLFRWFLARPKGTGVSRCREVIGAIAWSVSLGLAWQNEIAMHQDPCHLRIKKQIAETRTARQEAYRSRR
jgi:hypothetical protein